MTALAPHDEDLIASVEELALQWAPDAAQARAHDLAKDLPKAVRDDLAELGLMGLTLPESCDGAGQGLAAACRVIIALARTDRSVATTLGLHLGLGSRGLVAFGSPELQQEMLPSMALGESLGAFAATEPEAGSDLTRLATRITLEGDNVRVNGSKVYVTNGGWAKTFTIVGTMAPEDGGPPRKAVVILRRDDPGVLVGPEEDKLGLRASSTTSLHLDDVVVPRSRLVGDPADGEHHVAHILAWGRTVMAAGCVGTADAAWDATRTHTSQRRQFGKALSDLPVVAAQLVDADALRVAMRATVHWTSTGPDDLLEERSSVAKVLCSEGAWEITDLAVQLHGGSGYIEETGVPLMLRDARITRIFEGANDVLLGHVGARWLMGRKKRPALASDVSDLGATADAFAARVDAVVAALLTRHGGVRILRRPVALHLIGRMALLVNSVDATVTYAAERDLAAHWVVLAGARFSALAEAPDSRPALREVPS